MSGKKRPSSYGELEHGEWIPLTGRGRIRLLACCSCCLCHVLRARVRNGVIELQMNRDDRRTAALRRGADARQAIKDLVLAIAESDA